MKLETEELSCAVIIRDETEEKQREQELVLKSVAVQEMHHRVKNNLQTIAALLRLQIRRSENPGDHSGVERDHEPNPLYFSHS